MSVESEMEFRPEVQFRPEIAIPAETCEGGLGAARPTTDIASQYITADKPEITASYTSQEVTISLPILHTQTLPVHTCSVQYCDGISVCPPVCPFVSMVNVCILS